MTIAVYANPADQRIIQSHIELTPELHFRKLKLLAAADYDSFIALPEREPGMVLVMAEGASGMEAVIAARKCYPNAPVAWLSDDAGFGIQSYRLGCCYFAQLPLTGEMLAAAIRACRPKRL